MKLRIGLVALLFLMATLPMVDAQEENAKIYLHGMDAYWQNDTPLGLSFKPPIGEESATTCLDECAGDGPWGLTASWIVPVDLEPNGGSASGRGFVKSWNNAPAPSTTLSFTVNVDGVEVAAGEATNNVLAGAIVEYNFDMSYTGGAILAGQELTLDLLIFDETTGQYNGAAYAKEGPAYPWSFDLPLSKPLPPPAAPVLPTEFADIDASSLTLDFSYQMPSTQIWQYNWTNVNPVGNASVLAEIQQGSVHFMMVDDLNDTLLDIQLDGTYEQNQTFEGFEGNWTIRVTFTNFVGNATMRVMPDLPPVIPNPLAGPPNETFEGGNADDGSNDTPSVPILLALLGLAFVAMRRRA